jgi:prolyl-tRNA editing enzyme YbaK/EbsC (Cys-tRNA(Pro) deacylase)
VSLQADIVAADLLRSQLKRFHVVVTGGGATHSAAIIDPLRLAAITGAEWVDVCDQRVSG